MRSMSIVAVRASLASVSSRVDDRRMNESIPSHPFDAHACMHSRARWAWTTMYTHSDSIHSHTKHPCIRFVPHRPCMFYKTCMNDRFVPRIETQYVHTPPWSGSVDTHDGHTHILLYFTLYVYTVREVLHTLNTKEHVLDTPSINHALHAFVDATSRARLETIERRRRGRTNERTRSSSSPTPTKRDATASHSRANHRCRENPLAETEKSTREEFIHSFIRFGDARDGTLKSRDDIESCRCGRSRSRRRGRRETMEASETTDARIGRRDAPGRGGETGTRLGTDWRLERPIPIDEVGRARAIGSCRRERRAWGFEGGSVCWKRRAGRGRARARETRRRANAATREGRRRARARRTIRDAGETRMMMDGGRTGERGRGRRRRPRVGPARGLEGTNARTRAWRTAPSCEANCSAT